MKNKYSEKFSLKGKLAFILGGSGLIGQEVSLALSLSGARVICLDVKKNIKFIKKNKKIIYKYLDSSSLNTSSKSSFVARWK